MKELTVKELKQLIDDGADFQLVDVREPNEFEFANINGELIPMGSVPENVDKFSKDKQVIVQCRSGKRSADVIRFLEQNHGYDNLYNLVGGILAWSDEIDSTVPKY
ncbi:MAG: rhodanese-like domain-containing protein [Cytophagales bacterium]|nr:rhodanese-like domain-containing protein [Cytophagales bacterium]